MCVEEMGILREHVMVLNVMFSLGVRSMRRSSAVAAGRMVEASGGARVLTLEDDRILFTE